jgi:hypothetical protein
MSIAINKPSIRKLVAAKAAAALAAVSLAGCVVVPLGPDGVPAVVLPAGAPPPAVVPAPAPAPLTLAVRLYPTNATAAGTGVISGAVTNQLNGKGSFTLHMTGETLSGEATRSSPQSREGVASAAGSRGTYANCRYTMNNPTQGSGHCSFSTGAEYQLHIGG